jgi:hypothetical protein
MFKDENYTEKENVIKDLINMRRFYNNRQRDLVQLFVERAAISKI